MTFKEYTGKNVEEAIRAAMRDFEAELADLDIEILSQGSRGILGVGGEEARILAAPKAMVAAAETVRAAPESKAEQAKEEPAPEAATAPPSEPEMPEPSEGEGEAAGDRERRARRRSRGRGRRADGEEAPRERAAATDRPERREPAGGNGRRVEEVIPFISAKPLDELTERERAVLDQGKSVLEELLRLMELEATVEVAMGVETAKLNVRGSDLGVLIGRRGEKLASLQHIVNLIVAKREGRTHRVTVDVENYRGRREDQLRDVADRAAKRVTQSGKIIQLEAMPPVERRIVHLALRDNPKVRTQSVGVEPNRRVVILPTSQEQG